MMSKKKSGMERLETSEKGIPVNSGGPRVEEKWGSGDGRREREREGGRE